MSSSVYVFIRIPSEKKVISGVPTITSSNNEKSDHDSDNQTVSVKNVLQESLQQLGIHDAVWSVSESGNSYHICFPCDSETSDSIIEWFSEKDKNYWKDASVGIIPFSFFLKDDDWLCDQNSDGASE